jgi:putative transposase
MLSIIDQFSRQCLAIAVARRLNSDEVLVSLTELLVKHGPAAFIVRTTAENLPLA